MTSLSYHLSLTETAIIAAHKESMSPGVISDSTALNINPRLVLLMLEASNISQPGSDAIKTSKCHYITNLIYIYSLVSYAQFLPDICKS